MQLCQLGEVAAARSQLLTVLNVEANDSEEAQVGAVLSNGHEVWGVDGTNLEQQEFELRDVGVGVEQVLESCQPIRSRYSIGQPIGSQY